jgi:hypothetical protein
MRDVALKFWLVGTLVVAATACSEPLDQPTSEDDVLGVQFAPGPGPCDLIQPISSDVRDVFMKAEESLGRAQAKELGDACKAANQAGVTAKAWDLLSLLEFALDNTLVEGTPAQAALFADRLVACTTSLCETAAIQNL